MFQSEGGAKDGAATGGEVKGVESVPGASIGEKRTRGFPRIIKAGHGIKLGHVVRLSTSSSVCLWVGLVYSYHSYDNVCKHDCQ